MGAKATNAESIISLSAVVLNFFLLGFIKLFEGFKYFCLMILSCNLFLKSKLLNHVNILVSIGHHVNVSCIYWPGKTFKNHVPNCGWMVILSN